MTHYLTKEEIQQLKDSSFSAHWDGGGDSGDVVIDNGTENPELDEDLRNALYDLLGYGSFAGNFTTYGRITYDPDENLILCSGTETDYNEHEHLGQTKVSIKIPEFIAHNIEQLGGVLELHHEPLHENDSYEEDIVFKDIPITPQIRQWRALVQKEVNGKISQLKSEPDMLCKTEGDECTFSTLSAIVPSLEDQSEQADSQRKLVVSIDVYSPLGITIDKVLYIDEKQTSDEQ